MAALLVHRGPAPSFNQVTDIQHKSYSLSSVEEHQLFCFLDAQESKPVEGWQGWFWQLIWTVCQKQILAVYSADPCNAAKWECQNLCFKLSPSFAPLTNFMFVSWRQKKVLSSVFCQVCVWVWVHVQLCRESLSSRDKNPWKGVKWKMAITDLLKRGVELEITDVFCTGNSH